MQTRLLTKCTTVVRWLLMAGLINFSGVGVAMADPSANPFEGSWSGVYEVPELSVIGTVEFTISRTGVITGISINELAGYGHTLIAQINDDSWMNGVALPFEPGGPAEFYSGFCSIDENGNMVCDLTGCIQNNCFDLLVTVSRPAALAAARQGAPAAPDGCQIWFMPFFGGGWVAGASWNDRSDNEDGFAVEWRASGSPPQRGFATTVADATAVSLVLIPPGTTVSCRVRSFNALGDSRWSNRASGTSP